MEGDPLAQYIFGLFEGDLVEWCSVEDRREVWGVKKWVGALLAYRLRELRGEV